MKQERTQLQKRLEYHEQTSAHSPDLCSISFNIKTFFYYKVLIFFVKSLNGREENKHLLRLCSKTTYYNIFVTCIHACTCMYIFGVFTYLTFAGCFCFTLPRSRSLLMKYLLPYAYFNSGSGSIHLPIVLGGKRNTMHFSFTRIKSPDMGAGGEKSGSELP